MRLEIEMDRRAAGADNGGGLSALSKCLEGRGLPSRWSTARLVFGVHDLQGRGGGAFHEHVDALGVAARSREMQSGIAVLRQRGGCQEETVLQARAGPGQLRLQDMRWRRTLSVATRSAAASFPVR